MEKMVKQPLLQKAMEFAAMKHEGYVRKGTTIPYFTHVMEAMEIVSRMTEDEEVRAAAVLHDTLEDTPTTKKELIHFFGRRVADLVAAAFTFTTTAPSISVIGCGRLRCCWCCLLLSWCSSANGNNSIGSRLPHRSWCRRGGII